MSSIRASVIILFCVFLAPVSTPSASAQELIKPAPDMPAYTLGSIQQGKDQFGKPSVTISYQRNVPNAGFVKLAGRTADGALDIMGGQTVLQEQSGTIQLSSVFGQGKLDAEI